MTLSNIVQRRKLQGQPERYTRPGAWSDYNDPWLEMEKLVERAFNLTPVQFSNSATNDFIPSLELRETEKSFQVRLEIPGMNESDIDVSLSKDTLTISGEKKEECEENARDIYRLERRFGTFSRSVKLPENLIDTENVEASYKDGVLTIRLPKLAEIKESVKKIAVRTDKSDNRVFEAEPANNN